MTFGNFDGVHLGHQKLIAELRELSNPHPTVAFTFDPHPSHVVRPAQEKPLLMTLEERVSALLSAGVDAVYVQAFDQAFASLTADAFLETYLPERFEIRAVLLGFNFCYGRERQGCWSHFKPIAHAHGWKARHSTPLALDGVEISSSRIRELLLQGSVEEATRALGRPYVLEGVVVKGDQRGRLMGFPTANLEAAKRVLPPNGVYACAVDIEGVGVGLPAVMNCGVRPTLGAGLRHQIEAHILDFDRDIYGAKIRFHVLRYLRSELRFSGLDALTTQISADVAAARAFFHSESYF
jgi:riboflavin kinase/FMN adenylyltransferase